MSRFQTTRPGLDFAVARTAINYSRQMNLIRAIALNMIVPRIGKLMRLSLSKFLTLASFTLLCTAAHGQVATIADQSGATFAAGQLPDFTFTLTRVSEPPVRYSLVISDSDEHVISNAFSMSQLEILAAVLHEAEKFALSEEGNGTNEPLTTRFQDNKEQGFTVDVEKFRNLSRLYLTLTVDATSQTAEAGRINRTTRRESGFFFELVSRLEAMFPKPPAKLAK